MEEVEGGALAEPLQLGGAEGVVELESLAAAVAVAHQASHGPARRDLCQPRQADTVVLPDAGVVRGVLEGEGQEVLLLQIGLVDAGEAAGDDRGTAQEAGGERRVLAAAALAVVVVANHHPLDALGLIVPGDLRYRLSPFFRQDVQPLAGFVGEGIGGPQEYIVAELVQVSAIAQPHAGR